MQNIELLRTDADGSNFLGSGGANLTLPALSGYAGGVNYTSTLQATGTGSERVRNQSRDRRVNPESKERKNRCPATWR